MQKKTRISRSSQSRLDRFSTLPQLLTFFAYRIVAGNSTLATDKRFHGGFEIRFSLFFGPKTFLPEYLSME